MIQRLALIIALVLLPIAAHADDATEARTFFNAGAQAYAAARYGDAIGAFAEAYRLAPRPQIVFSLAQAERKEFYVTSSPALLRSALDHYKAYLAEVPSGGRRADAIDALGDLETRAARLDPAASGKTGPAEPKKARLTVYSSTPSAQVSVDQGPFGEVPYFGDLSAGHHAVRIHAEGYFDESRDVSGDRPVDIPLDVTLRERPALVSVASHVRSGVDVYVDGRLVGTTPFARPVEVESGAHLISASANGSKPYAREVVLMRAKAFVFEPHFETTGQRRLAWTLLGGGAVGILATGVFTGISLSAESSAKDVEAARAQGNITAQQLSGHNDAIDRRDRWRTGAIVSGSIGLGLALVGGYLFVFDKSASPPNTASTPERSAPKPAENLEVWVMPRLGHGVGELSFEGRF